MAATNAIRRSASVARSPMSPRTNAAATAPRLAGTIGGLGAAAWVTRKLRTTPEASAVNAAQPTQREQQRGQSAASERSIHRPPAVAAAAATQRGPRTAGRRLPRVATAAAAPSASSHSATSAKPPLTDVVTRSAKLPTPIQPATSSAHAQARASSQAQAHRGRGVDHATASCA